MKGFIRKKKRTFAQKEASRRHISPFIKTVMYVFLFVIIPAFFLGLCLNFFTFRKIFMQGILVLIFLLVKGYIFLSCLRLTNKWYLISDAFFIAIFAGLYHFVEHSDSHFTLLFFTVYITCVHFFFMVRNIIREGFASLKEDVLKTKHLFQKCIVNLVDVVKPIDVYIRKNDQSADNSSAHQAKFQTISQKNQENTKDTGTFEARCKSFFELFNGSIPLTYCEIIKIHRETNINILEQRIYTKKEFIKPLVCLGLIKDAAQYNNKRRTTDVLKEILLGSDSQGMLNAITILKGMKITKNGESYAKKMHNNWSIIK